MIENVEALSRLVDGLVTATKSGNLKWNKPQTSSKVNVLVVQGLYGSRLYLATSRNASYRLSSSDSFGVAPYKLTVVEKGATSSVPTLEMSSSTNPSYFALNSSLQALFDAVEATIEPTAAVVNRLLEGL